LAFDPAKLRVRLESACSYSSELVMRLLDLIKATLVCGLVSFLVYSFPVLAQGLIIGFLGLMWLFCAHQTVQATWRKLSP